MRPLYNGLDVTEMFEETVARYCGAPHAIAVNSCTNGIGMCLLYIRDACGGLPEYIDCPAHTYLGVPMQIVHAGGKIHWRKGSEAWDGRRRGYYHLRKTRIIDSARLFTSGMYVKNSLMVTSHHWSKTLGMEQGGVILTDSLDAFRYLNVLRSDGRDLGQPIAEQLNNIILGMHCYMSPETAAAGLQRMTWLPEHNAPLMDAEPEEMYPDLSQLSCFRPYTWTGKS